MDTESVIIWWVSPKHLTKYHQVIHVGICYYKGILSCNSRALKILKIRVFSDNFYAPLEKGGILFCNCQWWICRSVYNHVWSAQYLLTPSLDKYQTWCRGCPQWVDVPYWGSKVKVKPLFWAHCVVHFIYFNPLLTCFWQVLLLQRRYTWILHHWGHVCFWNISCSLLNQ